MSVATPERAGMPTASRTASSKSNCTSTSSASIGAIEKCTAMPPSLSSSLSAGRLEYLSTADGIEIPLRRFGPERGALPVVMLHGLQSHSAWFSQSARALGDRGRPVAVFDRRGSGESRFPRGDCVRYREMLEDISAVLDDVLLRSGARKAHLVGHCFGALPAALYAALYPERIASVVLATSAIYTVAEPRLVERMRVLASAAVGRGGDLPLPFTVEDLSELPEAIEFARRDPLALRSVTARFYWQVFLARKRFERVRHRLRLPVLMLLAGNDRIVDNARNKRLFCSLRSDDAVLILYPDARHILELSNARERFFEDIIRWMARIDRTLVEGEV